MTLRLLDYVTRKESSRVSTDNTYSFEYWQKINQIDKETQGIRARLFLIMKVIPGTRETLLNPL